MDTSPEHSRVGVKPRNDLLKGNPHSSVGPLQAPIRPRYNLVSLAHFSACTGWCTVSREACPRHRADLHSTL